ncbi:hypothetical protein CSQ96_20565 [Janthinobacterium sp. BJB412]|nr:hypothetical protein CSQ96_20565 [Janthinobacterium sp. BJB412]
MAQFPRFPVAPQPSCLNCATRQRCLPKDVSADDCADIDRLVVRRLALTRGDHLYQMNDPVRDRLYAIQSGQFKTYHLSAEGEQRITGFQFGGDFLGLDAIGLRQHRNNTVALRDAVLCEFSHPQLVDAARHSDTLARFLRQLLGQQLGQEQAITQLLCHGAAEQKIAGLLLQLSAGQALGHGNGEVLELAMSRSDIGDYLGLAGATVSRVLSLLQRLGYLTLRHRHLTINDAAGLRACASGSPPAPLAQSAAAQS